MTENFVNDYAYFRIADGIMFIRVKAGVVLNLDMAYTMAMVQLQLQKQRALPVCFDVSGIVNCTKEGRDFLAKFGWILAPSVALCASNSRSALIADFYLRINKPVVATNLFGCEADALMFLDNKSNF